jgi:poly(beta-D-mannuronate) lyase
MKNKQNIIVLFLLFLSPFLVAQEVLVSSISDYNKTIKTAKPGSVIVLKNGVWNDFKMNAFGDGLKGNPIIVKAETPGEVFMTGNSTLNISGNYVIVSGLWFKDGNSSFKSVVQFRNDAKEYANNCRFTNSTISYYKVKEGIKDHWVDLWGKNNRVDHNNFTGKTSPGTTLVVWLKGAQHTENRHRIDHNIFGNRPELGTNGGETIRIGTSANSMKSSKTRVESNVFLNCDGEIEIVSNKSGDNIFRENLFVESKGTLTLRHGNNALVENNVFLGNGVAKTGGIRIINEGHIVRNNLLIGLAGDGYRGAIVVMNGVPNSPLNRYHQVKNVDIQNNTIINSGPISFGEGKDAEKTLAPINTNFSNNLIYNVNSANTIIFADDVRGISFHKNYIHTLPSIAKSGFIPTIIDWKEINSFPIPTANNAALTSVFKNSKSPTKDITKKSRTLYVAGAFNLDARKLPKALSLRAGPGWSPNIIPPVQEAQVTVVKPGLETLRKAIGSAVSGSTLFLETGEYFSEKKIKITKDITIIGDIGGATIIAANKNIKKPIDYLFRVEENVTFKLSHVFIDGKNSNLKYAIVSPDKLQGASYNLFVDTVTFQNFKNKKGGSVFKAYNGTKADTLSFVNSRFENNYRGLNLSYDNKNMGMFNANFIVLKNSVFKNIEESAINYVRKIPNNMISGGDLLVENCVFYNVDNREKGKIIKADGIHRVKIVNSVFDNSYKIKTPIVLKGISQQISNCLINNSGYVKISQGARKSDLLYKSPKWEDKILFIPSKKSVLLKEKNKKAAIGLLQK